MDKVRQAARQRISALLDKAPAYKDKGDAAMSFSQKLDEVMALTYPTVSEYRDRLLFLMTNIPNVLAEIDTFTPETLATARDVDMLPQAKRQEAAREARRRARLVSLSARDSEDMMCAECHLPIRGRLNENRFGLDDDILGTQFDNNYDNLCQCGGSAEDKLGTFGLTPPQSSSSSDGEDGDQQRRLPQPAAPSDAARDEA